MKFNTEDIDLEIKHAKLELIKITAGILSAVLIVIGISAVTGAGWLIMKLFG